MSQNVPYLPGQPPPPAQTQTQTQHSSSNTQTQQNSSNTQTPTNGAPMPTPPPPAAAASNGLPDGVDMSMLAGVTPGQFAAIVRMIQQGLVPMPPTAPPAPPAVTPAAAPSAAPTMPWPAAPPQPSALTPAPRRVTPADQANGHGVGMDKEAGKLGKAAMGDAPQVRDFLRSPPKGPRKRSRSPLPRGAHWRGTQQGQAFAIPLAPHRAPSSTGSAPQNGKAPANGISPRPPVGKDAAAKAFILEMHRNGFGFDYLSQEVGDTTTLRRMYEQLGLPLPPSGNRSEQRTGVTVLHQTRQASMPKVPAKATPPQNRSEYLAKLQAAKNKKAETAVAAGSAAAPTAAATPPTSIPSAAPTVSTTAIDPLQAAKPMVTEQAPVRAGVLTKDKNDLIRQRLEKLKAEQAEKQQAKQSGENALLSSATVKSDSLTASSQQPPHQGLGAGTVAPAARAADLAANGLAFGSAAASTVQVQPPFPSVSPTLNRVFGLPGLFTTIAPTQQPAAKPQATSSRSASFTPAQNAVQPPSGNTQRPKCANEVEPNSSATPKQDFGPSKGECNDDRYVIEVSSDEDSGDAMDLDDDPESNAAPQMHYPNSTLQSSRPKLNLSFADLSSSATPTIGTPNSDLKRKLEEIEALKRRVDEAEKRKKASKSKAPAAQHEALVDALDQVIASSTALASDNATPQNVQSPSESLLDQTPHTADPTERHSSTSSTAARLAREQEKETLRKRLAELEAQRNKLSIADTVTTAPAQPQSGYFGGMTQHLAPVQAPPATDGQPDSDEIDDSDDEDLYGEEVSAESVGGAVAVPQSTDIGCRATALDPDSQPHDDHLHPQADASDAQDETNLVPHAQSDAPSFVEGGPVGDHHGDLHPDDSDDLDNIYARDTPGPAEPAVQTSTDAVVSHCDEEDDSDDAMDTSDASSSDSDDTGDSDAESRSEVEPEPETPAPSAHVVVAEQIQPATNRSYLENNGEYADEDEEDESEDEPENTNDEQDTGHGELNVNHDLAPELQPQKEEPDVPAETQKSTTYYTPYESPLHRFKDYRFHPEFEKAVPGGFKSLTYSHKIDPNTTMCPFELNGGSCIDRSCQHQHFRSLSLTDNDLLRLIGTENIPAHTSEEEKRWKAGLSALVKQLRVNNIKDVGAIAHRIADYRRDFVGDATKIIVGLED